MRPPRLLAASVASLLAVLPLAGASSGELFPAAGRDEPAGLLISLPPAQSTPRLQALVAAADADDVESIRFALGMAQALAAVENLGRGLYELGPRRDTLVSSLPILRLPVPENPNPKESTPADLDRLLKGFVADLAAARQTLQAVKGEVRLSVPITQLALDFDGDGRTGEGETVGDVLFTLRMVNMRPTAGTAEFFLVDFDAADVQWLIAYTHLLSGFAEIGLALDGTALWDHAGHLIFARARTPYDFLRGQGQFNLTPQSIGDLAAFVHLLRFPVREPARMEAARQHFLAAIAGSRRQFELARAETDDGREWIPNGRQRSAFENVRVTDEVIAAWLAFLDDAEGVLNGERLIPFWRTDDGRGVNLRRAFAEERELDAVLWFQGTAAAPYLERDKPLATGESFRRLQRVTDGNFMTFAVWFN